MADVNRKTVDSLVLHHAVTPTWEEKSKQQLIDWFSDNGFARGYGSDANRWSGLLKPNGQRSYSQAHFAGQRVNASTPDATDAERQAGFRLVQLVQDVWGQICWHAGNWDMNTRSIGIEFLGDYRTISLRENDCKVIADFWRPQDRKLNGATVVYGHNEVSDTATACPANIMNSRNHIVDLINAPTSGWAVITTFDEVIKTSIPYETETVDGPTIKKGTQEIVQNGVNGERTVITRIVKTDGKETSRSVISDTTVPPVTLIVAVGSMVETSPEIVPKPEDDNNTTPEPETPSTPTFPEEEKTKLVQIKTKILEFILALLKRIFNL